VAKWSNEPGSCPRAGKTNQASTANAVAVARIHVPSPVIDQLPRPVLSQLPIDTIAATAVAHAESVEWELGKHRARQMVDDPAWDMDARDGHGVRLLTACNSSCTPAHDRLCDPDLANWRSAPRAATSLPVHQHLYGRKRRHRGDGHF